MHSELTIAVVAGLGGMFGWGLADFFAKKTVDRIGSTISLLWAHVFGTTFLAAIIVFQLLFLGKQIGFPSDIFTWLGLLFFGALQATVYLLVYNGFEKGQLAILNPIFSSYSGAVACISLIFLGEVITGSKLFALLLIFLGILFINIDLTALKSKRFNFSHIPGFKEVGSAAVLAACWTILWDKFVAGQDGMVFAFCMYACMTLTVYIVAKVQKAKLSSVKSDLWKFLFLIGACEVIAYVSISYGFSMTAYLSVIALLSGAFSVPTVILARIFLKEQVSKVQTIGTGIIILGVLLLSI